MDNLVRIRVFFKLNEKLPGDLWEKFLVDVDQLDWQFSNWGSGDRFIPYNDQLELEYAGEFDGKHVYVGTAFTKEKIVDLNAEEYRTALAKLISRRSFHKENEE